MLQYVVPMIEPNPEVPSGFDRTFPGTTEQKELYLLVLAFTIKSRKILSSE